MHTYPVALALHQKGFAKGALPNRFYDLVPIHGAVSVRMSDTLAVSLVQPLPLAQVRSGASRVQEDPTSPRRVLPSTLLPVGSHQAKCLACRDGSVRL